ncbi:MAG: HD domain-containing protein [Thermoanaerobaculaceae bacterium]|nr:HD domain-containing protein [Thermoanaerobaculaceae bacterium]
MKLRWQLVVSHLVSILTAALLIGAVHILLLLHSTRALEQQSLDASLATASHLLTQKVAELEGERDAMAAFVAPSRLTPEVEELGRLHDLLALYRVERIEIFDGLQREAEAYRWERGIGSSLETTWFPRNPSVAAKIAGGRNATWVHRGLDGRASLKFATALLSSSAAEHRWLVLSEPLDGTLVGEIVPVRTFGAIAVSGQTLAVWPETAGSRQPDLASLATYLPRGTFSFLFKPLVASRPVLQLDDGTVVTVELMTSAVRSGESLLVGLQAWLVVVAGGMLLAFTLGNSLANRLLAPLSALLDGTAAMARGHLMVRLPPGRNDELGALTREFNRMADEIRNTYLASISTLAEVVEAKSRYTREHVERVEALVLATVEVLERRGWVRFSSHQRFLLSVAAILHDVGKIAIGNEILNKSGPLDPAERQQILTHPEVGALIVERMGKLERAAEIIRCAHEHFDGSGYPRGLRGEEIPLESRIILAVDAFDAMTMNRPYSNGRPLADAVSELRAEAGRQFDPVVVEALIEVVTTQEAPTSSAPQADSGLYRAIQSPGNGAIRPDDPRRQGDRG